MPDAADPEALAPDAVRLAAEELLGERLTEVVELGGSRRSTVLRVTRPDGSTAIVKRFGEGQQMPGATPFRREREGLRSLVSTPDLIADDDGRRLLVMTDAGSHPTLADLLRGDDPDAAWAGATRWARALGEVCGSSRPVALDVAARLATTGDDAESDDVVPAFLARLPAGTTALARAAGLAVPAGVEEEIERLSADVARDDARVASPGDTCPDNVLLPADGSAPIFVDLEGTDVHPVALDAAYALLPFATCWCVYDAPEGFTAAMLGAFTDGLRATAPDLVGPRWAEEVLASCVAWSLWMAPYLLERADDPEERMGPDASPSLTMREHLLMRLRWLESEPAVAYPGIAGLARDSRAGLERRWGVLPAPTYPAFAGCC